MCVCVCVYSLSAVQVSIQRSCFTRLAEQYYLSNIRNHLVSLVCIRKRRKSAIENVYFIPLEIYLFSYCFAKVILPNAVITVISNIIIFKQNRSPTRTLTSKPQRSLADCWTLAMQKTQNSSRTDIRLH